MRTSTHINGFSSPAARASWARTSANGSCNRGTKCCAWTTTSPEGGTASRTCSTTHASSPSATTSHSRSMWKSTRSTTSPARPRGALSVRSGADDQDERHRRHQHAWLAKRTGRGCCRHRRARSTAIHGASAAGELLGHVNPLGPARAMTRASGARRRCCSTITASTARASRSFASSTPMARDASE